MTVLEKTINDLRAYTNYPKPLCDIASDAILCLEEYVRYRAVHEPRVMTLGEVLALNPDTPIYFQHKSGESGWDIYRGIEDDITHDIVTGSLWAQGDYWYQNEYGKSFVCWTSCPTNKQRKGVKWE